LNGLMIASTFFTGARSLLLRRSIAGGAEPR
jgi:hypothetical protein